MKSHACQRQAGGLEAALYNYQPIVIPYFFLSDSLETTMNTHSTCMYNRLACNSDFIPEQSRDVVTVEVKIIGRKHRGGPSAYLIPALLISYFSRDSIPKPPTFAPNIVTPPPRLPFFCSLR